MFSNNGYPASYFAKTLERFRSKMCAQIADSGVSSDTEPDTSITEPRPSNSSDSTKTKF